MSASGAGRDHAALRHQHQVVGQLRHLVERMADIDHRDRQLAVQPLQVGQHLGLARRVQRGQRLVHQQQARAGGQRARDGHALALAAGQGVGPPRHQLADAEQLDRLLQRDAPALRRDARCGRSRGCGARPGAGTAPPPGSRSPARAGAWARSSAWHRPARPGRPAHAAGRRLQPGQRAQHRGLAAARRAEQRADAARGQRQFDIEREAGARAVAGGRRSLRRLATAPGAAGSAHTASPAPAAQRPPCRRPGGARRRTPSPRHGRTTPPTARASCRGCCRRSSAPRRTRRRCARSPARAAVTSPGRASGSATLKKRSSGAARSVAAASSVRSGMASKACCSGCTTKGSE